MLALQNPFYKNPESNAREILQQRMVYESEKGLQESLLELLALKSLLSQGHYCISLHLSNGCSSPCPRQATAQEPQQPSQAPAVQKENQKTFEETVRELPLTKETELYLSFRSDKQKKIPPRATDEFKMRGDSVEIVLDLKHVLPAEISVNIDERSVRVEANRIDKEGIKNCWRLYELPACVQPESGKCILSHDGLLHISVPWCRMEH